MEVLDRRAGAVRGGIETLVRSLARDAEIRGGAVRSRQQNRLANPSENRMATHARRRIRPRRVVPMDDCSLSRYLLLIDRVVRGIDDQPAPRRPEGLTQQGSERCVRRQPEREPVIHRHHVGEHEALTFASPAFDRQCTTGEIERCTRAQLPYRAGAPEVVERLLQRHLEPERPRIPLACAEEDPELAGERSATPVVLKRDLSGLQTEQTGRFTVEYLLDLLELDEVVARADCREPGPGEVLDQPRQLTPDPLDATVRVDVEATALFDAGQYRRIQIELLGRELRALGGAADDFLRLQDAAVRRRVGQRFTHASIEVDRALRARLLHVKRHERHAAIQRTAREGALDRVASRDRDARRHLLVILQVKVRQHRGRCGEVRARDALAQHGQSDRICRRVGALENADAGLGRQLAGIRRKSRDGHAATFAASSNADRPAPGTRPSAYEKQGSLPANVVATSVIGGWGGPSPVPAANVAAKDQYRRSSP